MQNTLIQDAVRKECAPDLTHSSVDWKAGREIDRYLALMNIRATLLLIFDRQLASQLKWSKLNETTKFYKLHIHSCFDESLCHYSLVLARCPQAQAKFSESAFGY